MHQVEEQILKNPEVFKMQTNLLKEKKNTREAEKQWLRDEDWEFWIDMMWCWKIEQVPNSSGFYKLC